MREDAAVEILNLMREGRESPTPPPSELHELDSPGSAGESAYQTMDPTEPPWSRAEDDLLRRLSTSKAIQHSGGGRRGPGVQRTPPLDASLPVWQEVSDEFEGRTPAQCMHRWQSVLNAENIKGEQPHTPAPPCPRPADARMRSRRRTSPPPARRASRRSLAHRRLGGGRLRLSLLPARGHVGSQVRGAPTRTRSWWSSSTSTAGSTGRTSRACCQVLRRPPPPAAARAQPARGTSPDDPERT